MYRNKFIKYFSFSAAPSSRSTDYVINAIIAQRLILHACWTLGPSIVCELIKLEQWIIKLNMIENINCLFM